MESKRRCADHLLGDAKRDALLATAIDAHLAGDDNITELRIALGTLKPIARHLSGTGKIHRFLRWLLDVEYQRC